MRCFVADRWRAVTVDDRVPVDASGQPLLVSALPLQLWPLLLTKAIFRLMAAYEARHCPRAVYTQVRKLSALGNSQHCMHGRHADICERVHLHM